MTGERKTLDTGIVTLSALTFNARIASHLRRHAITHLAFDVVAVGVGVTERTFGVYALRELDDGSGAADVVAVAWSDVADEAIDRVLVELDRLADERARANAREATLGDDELVVIRPHTHGVDVGVVCSACAGTGRAVGSDGVDWLPCRECHGTGLIRRLD